MVGNGNRCRHFVATTSLKFLFGLLQKVVIFVFSK